VKILLSKQAGGPDTLMLDERPEPQPGAGELRVVVHACGVNYPDLLVIQDLYQFKPPRPFAPGVEAAGTVDAVGAGVSRFKPGDRVIVSPAHDGMAEKTVAPEDACWPMPAGMPFDEAAALPMVYGTSYHALQDRASLQAGETLLVLGASGGVGLAAVQLGKAIGARVIAAASSEEKVAFAQAHGADAGVVYPKGSLDKETARALTERFKAACAPHGAHVIYDAIGGDYAEAALRAIAWGGRFLVVGFPAGIPRIPLNLPLLKSCQIVGVFWGDFVARFPAANAQNMDTLVNLYRSGKIRPVVTARFPLAQGGAAIAQLGARSAQGKIVVLPHI
jgi:NADPH2:quinone reductase